MGCFTSLAMSLISCSTMGVPATGTKGFGTVSVCGRKRDPRPAIGTIIFIRLFSFIFSQYFQSPLHHDRLLLNWSSTANLPACIVQQQAERFVLQVVW